MRIEPFKGLFYNQNLVKLFDVVTQPYDKITPKKKEEYQKRSSYNMVNIILPESYESAADLLRQWTEKEILVEDPAPSLYVYEQEYEYPKGKTKVRRGFVGLLELKPFGKDTIMPHERTFPKIKDDRMNLLSATKTNFGHIFVLFADNKMEVDRLIDKNIGEVPDIEFKDDDKIIHRIWKIKDPAVIKKIQSAMEGSLLFIADGHHRYSSALMYKEKEQARLGKKYTGKEGFNYRMVTFINADNPGLTILPTHRVLKEVPKLNMDWLTGELEKYFIVKKDIIPSLDLVPAWFDSISKSKKGHTLGMYAGGNEYYKLKLKPKVSLGDILGLDRPGEWLYLDVNILHLLILKNIMDIDTHDSKDEANVLYLRDANEAVELVKSGKAKICFILNPTKIEEVERIVELSDVMPHKSTDFYPKLYTGLVMRRLEG